jgi:hypothetical protein
MPMAISSKPTHYRLETPKDRVRLLRKAFEAMLKTRHLAKQSKIDYPSVVGSGYREIFNLERNASK